MTKIYSTSLQIFALNLREKYTVKIQTVPDMWYFLQVHAIKIRPPLADLKKRTFP